MKHTQSIEIERPVRDVFDYVTDPARLPEWDTDVRRGEVVSEGGEGVGARIEIERTLPPSRRHGTLGGRITEYEPMKAFAVTIDEGPMPFDLRYQFEGLSGATRLHVRIQSRPRGVRRLTEALFAPLIRSRVAAHYRTLKLVLEEPTDAG